MANNLIIYGGYAIHLLMIQATGKGIYSEKTLPDYDFYSPTHIEHSYQLADILQQNNFTNVSSISALHVTSRRVRINFEVVADISFMPMNIFENLPYQIIDGVRVIDPLFQRMDFHRSLFLPYSNTPMENIFNRCKKDVKRFGLLSAAYPITEVAALPTTGSQIDQKILGNNDVIYGGLLAYNLLYWVYKNIFTNPTQTVFESIHANIKKIITSRRLDLLPVTDYDVGNGLFLPPLTESDSWESKKNVVMLTDDIFKLRDQLTQQLELDMQKWRYFQPYADNYRPRTIFYPNIEIQDQRGNLIPFSDMSVFGHNIRIVNYQNVMLFLLQRYFTTGNKEFLTYYRSLDHMVKNVGAIIRQIDNDKELLAGIIKFLPFSLSLNVFGCCNYNINYLQKYVDFKDHLDEPIYDKKLLAREQFGYYPSSDAETKKNWPIFDIATSEIFAISGSEVDSFSGYVI